MDIYIRPLKIKDAETSYKWRNDSEIWKYTGFKPDKEITLKIETEWLDKKLSKKDEIRFAICIKDTNQYIGNVQLTNINNEQAQLHIFIGGKKYWGYGLGTKAMKLMIKYAFSSLNLNSIYGFVRKSNLVSIKACKKTGFVIKNSENDKIYMVINKDEK